MTQEGADLPLVSVSITAYNRADMVIEAIDSVIAQDYPNFEVIICDDGSTDGTGDVIWQRYGDRVTYFWQENQGSVAARNATLQKARGDYVAFMSDDDLWLPDKLSRQVVAMEANPDAGLCYGRCLVVTAEGEHTDRTHELSDQGQSGDVFGLFLDKNVIMEPVTMVRRSVLDEVGHFDPELRGGKDTDLFLRIALRYPAVYIPEPLMLVRVHAGRRTKNATGRERALRARAKTMAKLLGMLPRKRERFRPRLARLLVGARLEIIGLTLEGLSWEELGQELVALHEEPGAAGAEQQLAQGTASLVRRWGRAHPEQAGRLRGESLRELAEALSSPPQAPAGREARLSAAMGLNSLRMGKMGEGIGWLARGAARNLPATIGQCGWALGQVLTRRARE